MIVTFLGTPQLIGLVPSGPIHQDDGMGPRGDASADLLQVHLHGVRVGEGHHERRALTAHGTDRAEERGALIALVGRQAGPRAGFGPKPGPAVLLTEPGLVLEPEFDRAALREMAYMRRERSREVFLNPLSTDGSWRGCRGRPLMEEKESRASRSEMARSL
jgi:hypothetical protein